MSGSLNSIGLALRSVEICPSVDNVYSCVVCPPDICLAARTVRLFTIVGSLSCGLLGLTTWIPCIWQTASSVPMDPRIPIEPSLELA